MNGGVTSFGQFEFDHARGRLLVAGRPVELDRASAHILSVLLSEDGREVGKDRLLEAGWPGRVVNENSLAKAIVRLRHALGTSAGALETIHGYGYRLAVDPKPVVSPKADERPRRSNLFRRLAPVGAVAGILALAAVSLGQPSGKTQKSAAESPLVRGEPPEAAGRLLWVDDNPKNNAKETHFFERRGIAVYRARTSDDALALLSMYEYGAVLSDMNRNGKPLAGIKLVEEMRKRKDDTPYIVYTVVPSAEQHALVVEAGGQGTAVTSNELYAAVLPLFGGKGAASAE